MQLKYNCLSVNFMCQQSFIPEVNRCDVFIPSRKACTALSTQFSKCCNTSTISLLLLLGTTALTALICENESKQNAPSVRGTGFIILSR